MAIVPQASGLSSMPNKLMAHEKVGWIIQAFGILGLLAFAWLAVVVAPPGSTESGAPDLRLAFISLAAAQVLIIYLGIAIKRHRARNGGIVFGALLLIAFPIGTVIGTYILWNLMKRWGEGVAVETPWEALRNGPVRSARYSAPGRRRFGGNSQLTPARSGWKALFGEGRRSSLRSRTGLSRSTRLLMRRVG